VSRPKFATEGELCDAFADAARKDRWEVYPECAGWDLLLVRDGLHYGIEAKLRCNLEVVAQVLGHLRHDPYPHHVGVLVPKSTTALADVCRQLRINIECPPRPLWAGHHVSWQVDRALHWERTPKTVIELPPVPQMTGGGRPNPRTLSPWRIAALRLIIQLRRRGFLTSADFKAAGVNIQRWRDGRWVVRNGSVGRLARYTRGDADDAPDVGYERERDALEVADTKAAGDYGLTNGGTDR